MAANTNNSANNSARRHSGGASSMPTLFGTKPTRVVDDKNTKKKEIKILCVPRNKYADLDDAYTSFVNFLADPMALSYFRSYLYDKVCVENLLFYESVVHFREVEGKQTPTENAQESLKIFQEFFQPLPSTSSAHVINVDSGIMRGLSEAMSNVNRACSSTIFNAAINLVLHQMQTEWFYFKKAQQGNALLDNLNTNTFVVLPDPGQRAPVALPKDWSSSDDPVNWSLTGNMPMASKA